jgi:uncharacterized protein (TIGR02598 family)
MNIANQGFSLPETTLAIAISALGLTTLLAFVPQSLGTLRQASGVSSESRITQQILSSVTQAEWVDSTGADTLATNYDRNFYFDDLAIELDETDPGPNLTYIAKVDVANTDIPLPGGQASTPAPDPYLRRVTIKIANHTNENFDFESARPGTYRTYASVVTRSGK